MSDAQGDASARAPRSSFLLCALLYLALAAGVLGWQCHGWGALESPAMLGIELHAQDAAHPWTLGELLPYRYRPAFRALVLTAYRLGEPGLERFYRVFVVASALSLWLAALALHALLRALGAPTREALLGTGLFFLCFPVLFSHDMPIHTREDLLGYAWIALTLLALVRDRPLLVIALGVTGVAIRETCLLGVLPFAFVSRRPLGWKVAAYALPGAAWLALRALQNPGGEAYDYLGVSTAPTREFPLEALLYVFAAFGWLWVAAALRLVERWPARPRWSSWAGAAAGGADTAGERAGPRAWLRAFVAGPPAGVPPRELLLDPRVVLMAFAAMACTGWTMGMPREARITFILAPFVILLALEALRADWVRAALGRRAPWLAGAAVLFAYGLGLLWLQEDLTRLVPLRRAVGESFNPGISPVLEVEGAQLRLAFASPLNGLHVALNLAVSLWLLVARLGAAPGSEPGPTAPPS
ncbi:MAG: hypothetical protein AB7N76_15870 [Planctomycetota bacterium]